jgi:hypothetical protein
MNVCTSTDAPLEIASPEVVCETIDGEAVILNLDTGIYYSTTGAGADLIDGIVAGLPVHEVVDAVMTTYGGGAEMAAAVGQFLDEIQAERLVRPVSTPPSRSAWAPTWNRNGVDRTVMLRRYTDMEHLLLLDPVHDVSRIDLAGATAIHD